MGASCHEEGPRNLQRRSAPCQRQTQVWDLTVSLRVIALVPKPSTVRKHDLRPPDVLLRRVSVFNDVAEADRDRRPR